MDSKPWYCAGSALALIALTPGLALAQAASGPQLEEVVVTAQKRSENLQNVPIAVQTLSSQALKASQAVQIRDVQFSVPTLVFNQAANNAAPFLRGIGSDTNGPNYDMSVATYIDGVFIAANGAVIQNMLAVDRVEVLEGPQGTLYGRNAVGGAVNIYTLSPTHDFDAMASASYGNFNRTDFQARISGPVSDTLAVGLYGLYNRRETFYHKTNPNLAEPDHETFYGYRLKTVWTPTDALKITASGELNGYRSFEMGPLLQSQPDPLGVVGFGAPSVTQRRWVSSDQPQYNRGHTWAATIREEVDLGFANFLGVSAWRDLRMVGFDDVDTTSASLVGTGTLKQISRQWSQELQLLSPVGSKLTWIAGLYYFRENGGYRPVITNFGADFAPVIGAPANFYQASDSKIITNSYAAFAQVTAPLTDALNLTVGARYTIDKKAFNGDDYSGLNAFEGWTPTLGPLVRYPTQHRKWKKFTPKVTLDYKLGDTLLYGTYSKGFKSGAFNASQPSDPIPVNPENLTAFEVGTKSTLLDGRMRLNTAAFHYKFKNLQVQRVQTGAGGRTAIQNAAAAKAYGAEATVTFAVTHELTVNASGAWEHSKYTSFPGAATFLVPGEVGGSGVVCAAPNCSDFFDATGNRIQRQPKWVFSAAAMWDHKLANGAGVDASVKWYYNSGYFWEPTNRFRQDAYHLVNAQANYTLPGGHVTIGAWVNNLTDAKYDNSFLALPFGNAHQEAPPRMYGVTATWKY